ALVLVERPYPEWTVAVANNIMLHRKESYVAAQALAECPALSGSWKATLSRTTATEVAADTSARHFQ
ncbi:MAG: 3-alpha domain-containing protein, partial [Candidatus Nitrotoga sp.]|nr:3-alpha domain-containing protein [Candidatus Nitrotoga sp.]